jgi:signal transduction histidine kinase
VVQIGKSWEIMLGNPKKSQLISIAPLRAEEKLARPSGPILGVVEITQDLTSEYRDIFRFQILIVLNVALVMVGHFVVLLLVVKRGESIIEKRALERLRLKEELARAQHLSVLGEMVAGVSHEIRNPLGIILSSAKLLNKQMANCTPENHIPGIIMEEAGRLNSIITDFLNYARPQAPDLQICRLEEIVEKNLGFLATQLKEEDILIERKYEDALPEISGDPNMLYQAVLNIMLNAMQAMPRGGQVDIQLGPVRDHMITASFADHGPGIAPDIIDKVWDPFFTTKDDGTGLGLGIVSKIIEAHSGNVSVENVSDGGTRVVLQLPIRQKD